ncbi:MAG: transposase [Planctomycetaceae bacterium]|nr:transposase [Planctomycetaceae bacterium]
MLRCRHTLLISLAETREPLRIVNRSSNQTSEDGAAAECNGVADYLSECGFRRIVFRGDTAFSQTQHLDRWNDRGVTFYFGYKAMANVEKLAEGLAKSRWKKLRRCVRHEVKTTPRPKGHPVKENIVIDREYKNLVLQREDVAEFDYQPTACDRSYRMIVVRKQIDEIKDRSCC